MLALFLAAAAPAAPATTTAAPATTTTAAPTTAAPTAAAPTAAAPTAAAPTAAALPALKAGDLVFHRSTSQQSEAIARATHSQLTHVGVVLERDGTLQVFEAVQPVGWSSVDAWIGRGVPGTLLVKRLRDADAVLDAATLERMGALASTWAGRPYDAGFAWSDDKLYCSELVHKLFARAAAIDLGDLQHLGDFDLADPVVSAAMRARYGDRPPLREPVLSPAALAADPRLVPVAPAHPAPDRKVP